MRKFIIILLISLISCKGKPQNNPTEKQSYQTIKTSDFELTKSKNQNGLLILFPCFPCTSENTKTEFNITDLSIKNGFSVLRMNFNAHLYLNSLEKQKLANLLTTVISKQDLSNQNIYIGGFSSGGNIALLISDYLVKINSKITPKGVFDVDSPVDLLGLYKTSEKNIKNNFSKPSVAESNWIKKQFDNDFGLPENSIKNYEANSPYTYETQNIENLKNLKKLKIRFYTEPDLNWWRKNRKNEFKDLNAFYIQKLTEKLKSEFGDNHVELIRTENRGYRKNGERHPHSWSIIDKKELISWMTE